MPPLLVPPLLLPLVPVVPPLPALFAPAEPLVPPLLLDESSSSPQPIEIALAASNASATFANFFFMSGTIPK